ncbi:MBL fold metallo-hydrolase [Glaciecola sp. MF2-115]|uniref:MBL fold metallo-hydrolase n=1 Tax=Glaciecola sp. MF2-115 TaxID=3384827 RepID=UPI0039A0228F
MNPALRRSSCFLASLTCLILLSACQSTESNTRENGGVDPRKAHHTKDGFKNLYVEDNDKNFFDFLEMRFLGDEEWADHASLADQVPIQAVDIARLKAKSEMQANNDADAPLVTWLGHSMFIVQHNGLTLLTDPIFSERASPLSFAGPKRYVPHAMDYNELPDIDIVVISHNHYDHLDNDSIEQLAQKSAQQVSPIQFFVPLGLKTHLIDEGVNPTDISEMDWWSKALAKNAFSSAEIQALPSQHWSARGLSDRLQTLWASWAIDFNGFTVWFAGDTGYNDKQFKQIGSALEKVDLALIPIGGYEPRWFMKKYHVNPSEAVQIHQDVKALKSIGIHWGTFPMTAEEPGEPVKALTQEKVSKGISDERFITLAIGESLLVE